MVRFFYAETLPTTKVSAPAHEAASMAVTRGKLHKPDRATDLSIKPPIRPSTAPLCRDARPGARYQGFGPLMRMVADRITALLADKGYDADAIRDELARSGLEAVIPAKSNRRELIAHDPTKYRWRNQSERLFNKLTNWRVATRYDKTANSYLGFVSLASFLLWIPFVHGS